ncbi:GIN domain-containing protein [Massilia consociata]|uniref:GIN domain-containing protein n=1 Tax=Massilia consociata TaxID=760117 RepID=A0ABV6FK82_9BURK
MQRLILAAVLSVVSLSAHADEQVRSVTPFKGIAVHGPVSLTVEVGKSYSLKVYGDPRFIDRVTSEVVNGELRLGMKEGKRNIIDNDDHVVVTLPELQTFTGEGAGLMRLNKVRGERLDVNYRGAGRLVIDGQVRELRLRAQGVGEIDTRALVAQEADVSFEGIGSVNIHAKDKLNANVKGMGNLTYHGNPRVVNKSVSGIGSVVAAK